MTFTPKAWQNEPSVQTPINAAALVDLETRLSAYTDTSVAAINALPAINVKSPAYGAVCNGQRTAQVTSTSTSTAVTTPVGTFTASDVGKLAVCYSDFGFGTVTTIASVVSSTSIVLSANAGITLSGAATGCFIAYGTDDTAAVNAALTAAAATRVSAPGGLGYNEPIGLGQVRVVIPASAPGSLCCVSGQLAVPSGVVLECHSMVANLQTDRYNPVILFAPYSGFTKVMVEALGGNGVQIGSGAQNDVHGQTLVVWQCGQGYDSGTGRYQDPLWLNGTGHMIDLVWTKGGYHTVRHAPGSDTIINRCDSIGALTAVTMTSTNQVKYNQLTIDSPGQVGGGTSAVVLDNGCSDIAMDILAFEVSTVGARAVDNVVLLGNGSANKNIDVRMHVSAQVTGGNVINLQQAQDVQFDFIASNTQSGSSGSQAITNAVVWGSVAGSCDIRGQMSGSVTPSSGTVAGRYAYQRAGVEYVLQGGAAPTLAAGAALGTSPPAPAVTGNDSRGFVTAGTGTATAAGTAVTVTFASSTGWSGVTPLIILTPRNAGTAALQPYAFNVSATGFSIGFGVAPTASQAAGTYAINYRVFG